MSEIRLRDAVLADLEIPVVGGAAGEYREQMTRLFMGVAAGTAAVIVVELESEVAGRGFVELWGDPPKPWLGGLVVDEAYRRRGVATALIGLAEEKALGLGYEELRLSVAKDNFGAQALYDGLAYETIGEDMNSGLVLADGTVVLPPENVWVLSKKLSR